MLQDTPFDAEIREFLMRPSGKYFLESIKDDRPEAIDFLQLPAKMSLENVALHSATLQGYDVCVRGIENRLNYFESPTQKSQFADVIGYKPKTETEQPQG